MGGADRATAHRDGRQPGTDARRHRQRAAHSDRALAPQRHAPRLASQHFGGIDAEAASARPTSRHRLADPNRRRFTAVSTRDAKMNQPMRHTFAMSALLIVASIGLAADDWPGLWGPARNAT